MKPVCFSNYGCNYPHKCSECPDRAPCREATEQWLEENAGPRYHVQPKTPAAPKVDKTEIRSRW